MMTIILWTRINRYWAVGVTVISKLLMLPPGISFSAFLKCLIICSIRSCKILLFIIRIVAIADGQK
jgi:hypothetical protein